MIRTEVPGKDLFLLDSWVVFILMIVWLLLLMPLCALVSAAGNFRVKPESHLCEEHRSPWQMLYIPKSSLAPSSFTAPGFLHCDDVLSLKKKILFTFLQATKILLGG